MKGSALFIFLTTAFISVKAQSVDVRVKNGLLQGVTEASGIRSFKGIPFAKAPVGPLRWKDPQPAENWTGVRKADKFGANPMQKPIYGDMGFRSSGMSEDCLFLNVWAPKVKATAKLPVLVYFYGGGFAAGDGSEGRYDGEEMAKNGIVTLTVNYRLGIFGFMAHPELSKESPHQSSGNYGLLDQNAALKWVQENIAAFGGDPERVTIAGESAGSIAVSAHMASPLSKNLIAGAIGESGAMINPIAPIDLNRAETNGTNFGNKVNAPTITALRAIPAAELLELASKPGNFSNGTIIDGYFLPKSPEAIFESGQQAKVPLLAGWNSAEIPYQAFMQADAPTPENYQAKVKKAFPETYQEVLKLYPGGTQEEVIYAATALASDRFINFCTWKWLDLHAKTGGKPTYRYLFSKIAPPKTSAPNAPVGIGAAHAFEIDYAMGNLRLNKGYLWTQDDHNVSGKMLQFFANFIKTGNPNGKGLPGWTAIKESKNAPYMNFDVQTKEVIDEHAARYIFLDKIY